MEDLDGLTDLQRRFVEAHASGLNKVAAALKAGYTKSGAKKASSRLMKNPIVAKAIEAIQARGCELAAFDLEAALKEADDAAKFAREKGNPMANVKGCELKSKLAGHLIERVEITSVDLSGALRAAERRLINVTPCPHCGRLPGELVGAAVAAQDTATDTSANGAAHWETRIPGNTHEA